jgi:hypothetical protein
MQMGDLLSAASLLLTVLTILYSLWLPEITEAANVPVNEFPENRKEVHRASRMVFLTKALTLCVSALVLIAAMAPPAIAIMNRPIARTIETYDAVATIFVFVIAVLGLLSLHTIVATFQLGCHVWKLNPKRV